MNRKLYIYLAMMAIIPIAGELKIYPFEDHMRVSLGTPVFFFFLLWSRNIKPIVSGALVGLSVFAFRTTLLLMAGSSAAEVVTACLPVFFYYFIFALLFSLIKINSLHDQPLFIGILGAVCEIGASLMEISIRSLFTSSPFTVHDFLVLSGIAIIRSFFVLGFFNILVIRDTRLAEEDQRRRNEQMLIYISNLHIELIQLKKTMKNAENLTASCYGLYRDLKNSGQEALASQALRIAGEMHETKKDSQRVYSGLKKLAVKGNLQDFQRIEEIMTVICASNENYAKMLNKDIGIITEVIGEHPPYHAFTVLSIVNNLVSNAVESIKDKGSVLITAELNGGKLTMHVKDNGPGISKRNRPFIFEPGFTTKYDCLGAASNGIGLTYVKEMIEELGGEIQLISENKPFHTDFTFYVPLSNLTEKGREE